MKRTSKYPLQDMPTFEMQLKQTQQGSDAMCWWVKESIKRTGAHSFVEGNHNKNVEREQRERFSKTCRCRAIIFELDCFVALCAFPGPQKEHVRTCT